MKSRVLPRTTLVLLTGLLACAHISDVQTATLRPRYLRPTPASRSPQLLVVVYDPGELPDVVALTVPSGFPSAKLLGARGLVTEHLRAGLQSLFERVSVTSDAKQAPPDALLCTVHFVDIGLAVAPGGNTIVGTLEWSVAMMRSGESKVLYSWGERVVGSREGAGSFGSFDPAPVVQGAIEASLRTMLKDMDAKGVASAAAL